MTEQHHWIFLGALFLLAAAQQFRIYRIQRSSRKREELFQILTENAADMIALVDMKGRRLYNSPAYKRILGYSAAELGETSAFEQIHPDDRFKVLEAAREARETGVGKKLEYRIRHKNGSWYVFESTASTIRDGKGDVAKLVIVNRDITGRKQAEDQLQHNAFHDALTGLPNRRLCLDRLEHLFLRAHRNPENRYAVLLVDLDRFKAVNHSMGTAVGDRVLAEIARRVESCLRQDDTLSRGETPAVPPDAVLARFGGDEFTILLDAISDPSDAMRVAKRIVAAVSQPLFVDDQEIKISVSVGIALSHGGQNSAEELLQEADVAMRRAKALGGSRCEVFDEAMHTQAAHRLALESELRSAIDHRQFRVVYLPIVQLKTRRVAGFEALLRWQHPKQGLISPDKFMEAAEDTGLLVYIGHWLIVEACRCLRDWQTKSCCGPLNITVNLSPRQFRDAGLATDVHHALDEAGIEPAQLHLELTETVAMADPKLTKSVVSQLKHLGVGVILDNFGAGLASLRSLRQFPIEALKIDRSLVSEMASDRSSNDLVSAMVTLAHKLNLRVVAEGIESAKQLERLCELECDFGQGFLFSQPVEAEAAERLLRQRTLGGQPKAAEA
jgi:diguanylate cyclase (GGDEF)-like protein/PAS domain S-box-containing protein